MESEWEVMESDGLKYRERRFLDGNRKNTLLPSDFAPENFQNDPVVAEIGSF